MNTTTVGADRVSLLSRQEVHEYAGPAVQTLAIWRMKGVGPRFTRAGRLIRYRLSDVDAWLDSQAST